MDRESRILLEKIDCNCNNCLHMIRDFNTYDKWAKWHEKLDRQIFERKKELELISLSAIFRFEKAHLINYGHCDLLSKKVSFLPNTCQIDTQDCFIHRRTLTNL